MNPSTITTEATLLTDGRTLQLKEKLALPPGPVTVTVRASEAKSSPTVLEVLDRIHQEQRQRGRPAMTEEEMAAEIAHMRTEEEEDDARWREIWSQTAAKGERTGTP